MRAEVQKELPLKALEFLVLAALRTEPAHGYALVGKMAEQTGGAAQVRPGDLYRILYRLSKRGLVTADATDGRRNTYRLTKLGRDVLVAEVDMLSGVIDGVRGARPRRLRTS